MTETPWLTLAEACAYTRHSKELVRRAAVECDRTRGDRGLRGYQQSKFSTWRFHVNDLDRWMRGEPPVRTVRRVA